MFLRQVDLTTALRPWLSPDENLLFVQDSVGLYEDKFKLPKCQNGQAYLTSHRACYVDNEDPRNASFAVDLKDVDHCELYAGFLKSSPKVTLHPKAFRRAASAQRLPAQGIKVSGHHERSDESPSRHKSESILYSQTSATWICPICSFSNPVPPNFDPAIANTTTVLPSCLACGIKPPLVHVVKAAIANISKRPSANYANGSTSRGSTPHSGAPSSLDVVSSSALECPRCTFQNHPSLLMCEMCGARLITSTGCSPNASSGSYGPSLFPAPALGDGDIDSDNMDAIKFSFRGGGEKIFYERLRGALVQRKWLLQSAPPVPQSEVMHSFPGNNSIPNADVDQPKTIGIAGLELRDMVIRKNNEIAIGNAFEDLDALMASAKEIIALAENFASQNKPGESNVPNHSTFDTSAMLSQLNLTTTKDMLSTSNASGRNTLYLTELSRQLAEYLTDETTGLLKSEGGIISLVDLWAVFNRARGGVELVSPTDFTAAANLFERLKLPVRLRMFKSGLLVVQGRDRTDEKTVASLTAWLKQLRDIPPEKEVTWDWRIWGRGVTALETAERFGWSVGVASEELEMAEEIGALCRDVGIEGVRFWENWLVVEQLIPP